MSYSQALEEQLKWARWAEETLLQNRPVFGAVDRMRFIVPALTTGDTYYWAPSISRLLTDVTASLPEAWRFDMTMLPTRRGFFWFDRGLILGKTYPDGFWIKVEALAWASGVTEDNGDAASHVMAISNQSNEPSETRLSSSLFRQGETLKVICQDIMKDCFDSKVNPITGVSAAAVFAACLSFLQQRILVTPEQRAERHTRKRLENQGWQHEPVVRVVELRRKQATSEHHGDSEPVEWSHQWIVSGHWRQQWYPSLNTNQPIWVMPYVKGPEDKPLKPPRAKVFAVVR